MFTSPSGHVPFSVKPDSDRPRSADYYDDLHFTNLLLFNDKLLGWLSWYNSERPHHGLGLQSPLQ